MSGRGRLVVIRPPIAQLIAEAPVLNQVRRPVLMTEPCSTRGEPHGVQVIAAVSVLALQASISAIVATPDAASAAEVVVAKACWPDPGFGTGAGCDGPTMATVTLSKFPYAAGETVRVTMTIGPDGTEKSELLRPSPVSGDTYLLSGVFRVRVGWSGQQVVASGGTEKTSVDGSSVIFFAPPSFTGSGQKAKNFIGNQLFEPGRQLWVDFVAPDPATDPMSPGGLLQWQVWTDPSGSPDSEMAAPRMIGRRRTPTCCRAPIPST